MTTVRMLMAELVDEELVHKKLDYYKLDTLLIRETRMVSQLGQLAIDRYIEALQKLAPESASQRIIVPVKHLTTLRKGKSNRRVVLKLAHPQEIVEERQRALAITRRMTALEIPLFSDTLDITLGVINPNIDTNTFRQRLEALTPPTVTLLPTVIQTSNNPNK